MCRKLQALALRMADARADGADAVTADEATTATIEPYLGPIAGLPVVHSRLGRGTLGHARAHRRPRIRKPASVQENRGRTPTDRPSPRFNAIPAGGRRNRQGPCQRDDPGAGTHRGGLQRDGVQQRVAEGRAVGQHERGPFQAHLRCIAFLELQLRRCRPRPARSIRLRDAEARGVERGGVLHAPQPRPGVRAQEPRGRHSQTRARAEIHKVTWGRRQAAMELHGAEDAGHGPETHLPVHRVRSTPGSECFAAVCRRTTQRIRGRGQSLGSVQWQNRGQRKVLLLQSEQHLILPDVLETLVNSVILI
mmetsp:Transcript_21554/g.73913  ORF Transcript_21554/g.73913 Transcript_21554/m.73913 type:complete len:307 (-) Transcript_21554:173-1093(-)